MRIAACWSHRSVPMDCRKSDRYVESSRLLSRPAPDVRSKHQHFRLVSGWHGPCCTGPYREVRPHVPVGNQRGGRTRVRERFGLRGRVHPICAARQHDCGKGPTIQACCCGDQSSTSDQTAPSARVTVNVTLLPVVAVAANMFVKVSTHAFTHAVVPPPRSSPVDLRTLFASLLI
jgi:hypothetical protein